MCVLVFLYEVSLPSQSNEVFECMYGAIPAVIFGCAQLPPELMSLPVYGTLFSPIEWVHLIENMLYLWASWSNAEDVMGMPSSFCSICGVVGAHHCPRVYYSDDCRKWRNPWSSRCAFNAAPLSEGTCLHPDWIFQPNDLCFCSSCLRLVVYHASIQWRNEPRA